MERLFRVEVGGEIVYAVDRDGDVRRAVLSNPAEGWFGGWTAGEPLAGGLAAGRVLAPVMPSKIVCVGLNYKDHAKEQGKPLPPEPLIFMKPRTCVINPGDPIRLPPGVGRCDYESELAIVIGKRAHRVQAGQAWDYVLGYTCMNDVTARAIQKKEGQYTRAKGFDTFAPLGPAIVTGWRGEPRRVEGLVNGALRQNSTTEQLIFPIEQLIEFITFIMTLEPGDVISTGTPEGIGPLEGGDVMTIRVEGAGELTNPVEAE